MDYIKKMKLFKEMKDVGISSQEMQIFFVFGIGLWAVLTWMFSERVKELDTFPDTNHLRNISIIILSFHVITFVFTLMETNYMSSNIWVSWMTIGLALSATFLNAAAVAIIVNDNNATYTNLDVKRDISSLVLQCMANALMTAYIFKIIRSKKKTMY